jgi:hypothetical protein
MVLELVSGMGIYKTYAERDRAHGLAKSDCIPDQCNGLVKS